MDDQNQQDPGQEPAQSQEQPSQDSGLQTPQPDQPVPSEAERQPDDSTNDSAVGQAPADAAVQQDESAGDPPLGTPSNSQEQAAVQRETELEQARRERQARLGNEGEIREGEVQAQRQEHNQRTGGGDVPQADSAPSAPDEATEGRKIR
jgi:hypothetical protein